MKYVWSILVILILVFSAGCQAQEAPQPGGATQPAGSTAAAATGYPSPANGSYPAPGNTAPTATANGYPAAPTPAAQNMTAFQAYKIALPVALKWNPNAVLFYIPSTYQQETNFGHPHNTRGWYFMFKEPGSPLEYYVSIDNGELVGDTEAQQILGKNAPPAVKYQQLPDLSKMIDSDKFIEIYKQNGGDKYLADHPNYQLNPQLIYLEGDASPIWRMFDGEDVKVNQELFAVNALTGEVVNPK